MFTLSLIFCTKGKKMELIMFCLTVVGWALVFLIPVWIVICLAMVLYFISKTFGISDLHSDDYYVFVRLFFGLVFLPIWKPIMDFIQKRESKKIKNYVDSIRNRPIKTETEQEKERA